MKFVTDVFSVYLIQKLPL